MSEENLSSQLDDQEEDRASLASNNITDEWNLDEIEQMSTETLLEIGLHP